MSEQMTPEAHRPSPRRRSRTWILTLVAVAVAVLVGVAGVVWRLSRPVSTPALVVEVTAVVCERDALVCPQALVPQTTVILQQGNEVVERATGSNGTVDFTSVSTGWAHVVVKLEEGRTVEQDVSISGATTVVGVSVGRYVSDAQE